MNNEKRTIWCGNLSDKVTEELLYELFLQAAPLERVKIPADSKGRKSNYAFITVKHEVSVDYIVQLLNGISLFGRKLHIKPRNTPTSNQFFPKFDNPQIQNANIFNELLQVKHLMKMNCDQLVINENQMQPFNRRNDRNDIKNINYRKKHDNYNYIKQGRHNEYNHHRNYDRNNRRHKPY